MCQAARRAEHLGARERGRATKKPFDLVEGPLAEFLGGCTTPEAGQMNWRNAAIWIDQNLSGKDHA